MNSMMTATYNNPRIVRRKSLPDDAFVAFLSIFSLALVCENSTTRDAGCQVQFFILQGLRDAFGEINEIFPILSCELRLIYTRAGD